jgi:hypothetical protein
VVEVDVEFLGVPCVICCFDDLDEGWLRSLPGVAVRVSLTSCG